MALFGKKSTRPEPSIEHAGKWVLHRKDGEYAAASLDVIRGWFRSNAVPPDSTVFDPVSKVWLTTDELIHKMVEEILATTTPGIDDHSVKRYIGIESVEIVIGTGVFSEMGSDFADFFGTRSTAFERKLQQAKAMAIEKLKFQALRLGGNAIIGIDLDYTEFSGNRIGVVANGTVVEIVGTTVTSTDDAGAAVLHPQSPTPKEIVDPLTIKCSNCNNAEVIERINWGIPDKLHHFELTLGTVLVNSTLECKKCGHVDKLR